MLLEVYFMLTNDMLINSVMFDCFTGGVQITSFLGLNECYHPLMNHNET